MSVRRSSMARRSSSEAIPAASSPFRSRRFAAATTRSRMSTAFRAITVLFVLAWTLGVTPLQSVSEDDYQRLVELKTPAVSPDAAHAAVVLVDIASGTNRTLVDDLDNISDPAFSPDGTQLAFLGREQEGKDPHTQVFVMPAEGGEAHPVTFASAGVGEFAWRPDGRALSFVAADGEPPRVGSDRFRDSFIFTTEPITTRAALQPSHLFTVSLDDGTTTQLTFGSQSVSDESWSPDGKSIVFTLAPNAITNDQSYSRIAIVNVSSRRVRPLTGRAAWEGSTICPP